MAPPGGGQLVKLEVMRKGRRPALRAHGPGRPQSRLGPSLAGLPLCFHSLGEPREVNCS